MSHDPAPPPPSAPADTPRPGRFTALARPVDVASLAVFRVSFGLFAAGEAYRLVADNLVRQLWMSTSVFFPWPAFAWLPKLPGDGMHVHFYLLALVGLSVAAGLFFRVACVLLALGFIYPMLLCETTVVADFVLLALLALLLATTPAQGALSVDAWLRPRLRRSSVPAIALLLLRGQVCIVQLCMGLWMLGPDWLRGAPLHLWLPDRAGMPLLGWLHATGPAIVLISCGLTLVFLAAPVGLWFARTRRYALALLGVALLWIEQSFEFGALPWLLLIGNLLFLPPGWPRRLFNWPRATAPAGGGAAPLSPALAGLVAAWLAIQLLVPLRGFLTPGDSAWTEQGLRFSWRIPGPAKASALTFSILDPATQEARSFDPKEELSDWQYGRVAGNPSLVQRYARGISRRESAPGAAPVEVRALTLISLNGREPQRLVDPKVDLARAEGPSLLGGADWILPLEVPLQRQWKTDAEWLPPRDELPVKD